MKFEIAKSGHVMESSASLEETEKTLNVPYSEWVRIVGEDYSKTQVFNVKCERFDCQVIKTLYK